MINKELKKLLADCLNMESELYDFCVDCLKKIYGDRANQAIYMFEESVEMREPNGCIQSLEYIDNRINLGTKYTNEMKELADKFVKEKEGK